MKVTIFTAALVVAFASAQQSSDARPEFTGVPSFAGEHSFGHRPTDASPSGIAHPSGHHGHHPSGAAHPSGHHGPPHHKPTGMPEFSGSPTGAGHEGAASSGPAIERRQEEDSPMPSGGLPSDGLPGGPGGAAPTGPPFPPSDGSAQGSHLPHPPAFPHPSGGFGGAAHGSGHAHPSGGFPGFGEHGGHHKHSGSAGARPTAAPSFVGSAAAPSGFQTVRRA